MASESVTDKAARFIEWRRKKAQKSQDWNAESILDVCEFIEAQDIDRTIIGGGK